jgi:hypothetical protein
MIKEERAARLCLAIVQLRAILHAADSAMLIRYTRSADRIRALTTEVAGIDFLRLDDVVQKSDDVISAIAMLLPED